MAGESKSEGKKKKKQKQQQRGAEAFEFCEACGLNHDHGRRHKYIPSHLRALSLLLSRFRARLLDVRFFVKNPSKLRPEHSHLNRIWCPFCAADLLELGSVFVCGNAIEHMASEEHARSVKNFMWKHGGAADQAESFQISEADLLRWEKGCKSLDAVVMSSSSKAPIGPLPGPSKDIQIERAYTDRDSLGRNALYFSSSVSCPVLPLQSLTNEGYGLPCGEVSGAGPIGHIHYFPTSMPLGMQVNEWQPKPQFPGFTDAGKSSFHTAISSKNVLLPVAWSQSGAVEPMTPGMNATKGFQNLTPVSLPSSGCKENVNTGARPPWLDTSEECSTLEGTWKKNSSVSVATNGKSTKLNPKRVGAAWAEKRRIELEKERRGEIVENHCDANWLPNFGRVWQEGTRKESRKEFEKEKLKIFKDDNNSLALSSVVRPYISKRQRTSASGSGEVDGESNGVLPTPPSHPVT